MMTQEVRHRPRRRLTSAAAGLAGCLVASALATGSATPASAAPVLPVVSSGGGHTCAVTADHNVWCWGLNTAGQLGNGTLTDSLVPARVDTLQGTGVIDVTSGHDHTCALNSSHQVRCWGSDAFGQLGDGATSAHHTLPAPVLGLQAVQVSAGDGSTCAVTVAKTVKCWGDNNYGELGDGTFADSSTPRKVKDLSNVVAVADGYFHACALESNGAVWCWGSNTFGALGNGTTKTSDTPVKVPIESVTAIAAGADDSCAIRTGGDLMCWGENGTGKLGVGDFNDRRLPAQVSFLTSGVTQVTLGEDFSCAITFNGGSVMCWGDAGGHGQLGNGRFHQVVPVRTRVFGLQGSPAGVPGPMPRQVASGSHHTCLVMVSGQIECWGNGADGDLATGSALDHAIPTATIGLPEPLGAADAVVGGGSTSCAITPYLEADCWGQMVGDGISLTQTHTTPVQVVHLPAHGVSQVTAGYGGCALVRLGGLATGLRCWGVNTFGDLGNGTTTPATAPVTVKKLPDHVQSVTSGANHNCALVQAGGAWCWGYNQQGQLGDGTTKNRHLPVVVKGLPSNLAQIATAEDHTCALRDNGSVACWGLNSDGQLGDGTTNDSKIPVSVAGLSGVVQIGVGDAFSCALTMGGAVKCWGMNIYGELGDGSTTDSQTPVNVIGLPLRAQSISAGDASACATLLTGQVDCWGDNINSQLGDGSTGGFSETPVAVVGLTAGGAGVGLDMGQTGCATNASQQALCWGLNNDGQLGDGTQTDSNVPVLVQF